jgi:hypothetical protein
MSVHFWVEERPGADSHFDFRAALRVESGRRERRSGYFVSDSQGSWEERMSILKWSRRRLRLRLWEFF